MFGKNCCYKMGNFFLPTANRGIMANWGIYWLAVVTFVCPSDFRNKRSLVNVMRERREFSRCNRSGNANVSFRKLSMEIFVLSCVIMLTYVNFVVFYVFAIKRLSTRISFQRYRNCKNIKFELCKVSFIHVFLQVFPFSKAAFSQK